MSDRQRSSSFGGSAPAAGSARARPAVLVVEDDRAVRHLLGHALPTMGYDVELAADGLEAIALYRQNHFDLVLLDVQMPGMDGPATLQALRGINADVICCFMTGWPGNYTGDALLDLGAAGCIQKPFSLAELGRLLARALEDGTEKQF